jgi:hypothetical protein
MEIAKVNSETTQQINPLNQAFAPQSGGEAVTSEADAATVKVQGDFERDHANRVAIIKAAVQAGEYQQPDSRILARAVAVGLNDIIQFFNAGSRDSTE